MKYTKEDFNYIINELEKGEYSLRYICRKSNYDYKYIHRVLTNKFNYKLSKKKPLKNISKLEVLNIYNKHLEGFTIKELSKIFKLSFTTIKKQFNKYNLKQYKFNDNKSTVHTFFDTIDNEIKAYLLGFFCGDGTINKTNSIAILLQAKDVEILDYYKNNVSSHSNYYLYKAPKESCQDRLKIVIHSGRIKDALVNHGIPENKTYKGFATPNEYCNKNLYRHFIRGFFDADGSIYKSYRAIGFKITCTNIDFLHFCESEFKKLGCYNIFFEKKDGNAAINLKISNKNSIKLIKNYFYKDCNYYLKRKYDKFNELV